MLSPEDYNDTLWKFNNIPTEITGKNRRNIRQVYRKKLMEHYYASNYPPFQPSPYELIFVNYRTTENTLIKLIQLINSSTLFIIDTESICILHRPNKPALIQLQIITRELDTYMVLIEIRHLPKPAVPTFALIQEMFESLFQPKNKIYIWGQLEELEQFIEFSLFSPEQIYLFDYHNLQDEFKLYWYQHHPHEPTAAICICEQCIGIQLNNPWGIQDAAGYQLHKWLDKRLTRSQFDIGLDPTLVHLNSKELEHRQKITRYASYDCDAMFQLLISMNLIEQQQSLIIQEQTNNEVELMLFDENEKREQELFEQQLTTTASTIDPTNNELQLPTDNNYEIMDLSTPANEQMLNNTHNNNEPYEQEPRQTPPVEPESQQTPPVEPESKPKPKRRRRPLTEEEKRTHNRACTLRQRRQYYRYEIKRENIDRRFTPRIIKDILRQRRIPFTAVNFSTSSITNQRTLYIGIKDKSELKTIERQIHNLFSREHYQQFTYEQRESYRHRHRHNHHFHHEHNHYHRRTSNR